MDAYSENIQVITDPAAFRDIFYTYYANSQINIKTDNNKDYSIIARFFGYTDNDNTLAFKIPGLNTKFVSCISFVRSTDYTIFTVSAFISKEKDDVFLLRPAKIQVVYNPRKGERKKIQSDGEQKKLLYVTNTISDFVIENSLSIADKKLEKVKEVIKENLEKYFSHIRVMFMHESKLDMRMKFFLDDNKTIMLIEHIKSQPREKYQKIFEYYTTNVYPKDRNLNNNKELISEICVPILYNTKIPFGYVQVNNTTPFTEESLPIVKKMAAIVEILLKKHGVFPVSDEKILVTDISKFGIGLVFDLSKRKLVRYFKEGNLAYFDVLLPENRKCNVLATVQHVTNVENKVIRIGCRIKDIDALSEVYYDEFLETLGIDPYAEETPVEPAKSVPGQNQDKNPAADVKATGLAKSSEPGAPPSQDTLAQAGDHKTGVDTGKKE